MSLYWRLVGAFGLRARLVILITAMLMLVLGGLLLHYQQHRQQAKDAVMHHARSIVMNVVADQERVLSITRQVLATAARLPEVLGADSAACSRLLAELLLEQPAFTNMGVARPDGILTCSAQPFPEGLSIAGRHNFKSAVTKGEFAVGHYTFGRLSGEPVLPAAYPVFDADGQVQAVLVTGVSLAWLRNSTTRSGLSDFAELSLTILRDHDGTSFTSTSEGDSWVWISEPAPETAERVRAIAETGFAELAGPDGRPWLYTYAPFGSSHGHVGDAALLGVPADVAFGDVDTALRHSLVLLVVLTLGVFIIANVGAEASLIRPIKELVRFSAQLAGGRLDARIDVFPGDPSEVRELSTTFNSMAAAVQSRRSALRASEERFRRLAENAPVIIYRYELSPERRFSYMSPAVTRVLGYTPDEHYADPDIGEKMVHPDDRRRLMAVRHTGATRTTTVRFRHKEGHWVWLELRSAAIRSEDRSTIAIEGVSHDITLRKLAEQRLRRAHRTLAKAHQELKDAQHQVIQHERLAALGQMASGIAHDLNNTLSPMLGYAELLLVHPDWRQDDEKLTRFLTQIHLAAQDATTVVNRLREFYRYRDEGGPTSVVDLHQVVREAVTLTRPRWQGESQARGAEVELRMDVAVGALVEANAGDLRQMLMNLILNAVDAMPRGGAITILGRVVERDVELAVSDTGVGMSEETRLRCLEPFFTTKGDGGTGLGLATVYGTVHRYGGSLDLQSEPGKGTTITIHLPRAATASDPYASAASPRLAGQQRILLVDDEVSVREVVSAALEGDGHIVTATESGEGALDAFRRDRFDVVITDRAMPGINGDQLAAAINRSSPETPVIMLSGFGAMMRTAGEQPPGVNLVLSKPVILDELREGLVAVLRPSAPPSEARDPQPVSAPTSTHEVGKEITGARPSH